MDYQHLVYHYCPLDHIEPILASGELQPSGAGARASERPALWFTSRPTYEPTAIKMIQTNGGGIRQLTLAEQATAFGLARIVVPASLAPLTWRQWVRESGVRAVDAKRLARCAKAQGSDVALYRATFEPVPLSSCFDIEVSDDGTAWVPSTDPAFKLRDPTVLTATRSLLKPMQPPSRDECLAA